MLIRKFDRFALFNVHIVPTLRDNLSYIIEDVSSNKLLLVDPVEPGKMIPHFKPEQELVGILTTHHHSDHSGGNLALKMDFPGIKVYGFDERIPGLTDKLNDSDTIALGSVRIKVVHTPCHTTGSVCFLVQDSLSAEDSNAAVFTGDTLFLGGCGRFFEGNSTDMLRILTRFNKILSDDTVIFPGHDYIEKNLTFACKIIPKNKQIAERLKRSREGKILSGLWSEERASNIFLKFSDDEVKRALGLQNELDVLKVLRESKDNF